MSFGRSWIAWRTRGDAAVVERDHDAAWMARAVQLARRGWNSVTPNPRVGCVLVRDGERVGEGWHCRAGEPHAEIHALQQAGDRARGATAYVTLEPCSHHGRTAPCAEALVTAGVARVVYGMQDPFSAVAGRGLARLQAADIEVHGPMLETQAEALNCGYIQRQRTGLPRVTVKMAMSLDGRTAMASGESQWITGPEARADVQRLRAASCAIVTGIGTVLRDDARLTVREPSLAVECATGPWLRQPLRVILDRRGQLPDNAALLREPGPVLHVTAAEDSAIKGIDHWQLPAHSDALRCLLSHLGERGCNEVLVEAGSRLAGAFVAAGLVDEVVLYIAFKLLGSTARPLLELPFEALAQSVPLTVTDERAVGADRRLTLTPTYQS